MDSMLWGTCPIGYIWSNILKAHSNSFDENRRRPRKVEATDLSLHFRLREIYGRGSAIYLNIRWTSEIQAINSATNCLNQAQCRGRVRDKGFLEWELN